MTGDISIVQLILGAGWVVKFVLLLLLVASIASWAVIIDKSRLLKRAINDADEFETGFWSGVDLGKFYQKVAQSKKDATGMAGIFHAGPHDA